MNRIFSMDDIDLGDYIQDGHNTSPLKVTGFVLVPEYPLMQLCTGDRAKHFLDNAGNSHIFFAKDATNGSKGSDTLKYVVAIDVTGSFVSFSDLWLSMDPDLFILVPENVTIFDKLRLWWVSRGAVNEVKSKEKDYSNKIAPLARPCLFYDTVHDELAMYNHEYHTEKLEKVQDGLKRGFIKDREKFLEFLSFATEDWNDGFEIGLEGLNVLVEWLKSEYGVTFRVHDEVEPGQQLEMLRQAILIYK